MNKNCLNPLLVTEKGGGKYWGSSEVGWAQEGCQTKTRATVEVLKGQPEEILYIQHLS